MFIRIWFEDYIIYYSLVSSVVTIYIINYISLKVGTAGLRGKTMEITTSVINNYNVRLIDTAQVCYYHCLFIISMTNFQGRRMV